MEALCSGTPVVASRVPGNVGMLGADHAGYFEVGDAAGLAQALRRFQSDANFRSTLQHQGQARAACFEPAREARDLHALVDRLRS
jgi:glycosyltransferase involved in cell wall biosynthesis